MSPNKPNAFARTNRLDQLPDVTRSYACNLWAALTAFLVTLMGCDETVDYERDMETDIGAIISDEIVGLDVESPGPYTGVITANYDFGNNGGVPDPKVQDDRLTDVRGNVHVPDGSGPFPLLVFLHGNHGTCRSLDQDESGQWFDHVKDDPFTGTCPAGYKEAPSFEGYDYVGKQLASHGFVVASINANVGLTGNTGGGSADPDLIMARGRLVLKHLAHFRRLTEGTLSFIGTYPEVEGVPNPELPPEDLLEDKIDFHHVGLMGHSRGGEGVRAAHYLFVSSDPYSYADELTGFSEVNSEGTTVTYNMNIEAIFEFAPVDLSVPDETGDLEKLPIDAPGVHRTVVLGTCDNDSYKYEGMGPFTRRRMSDTQTRVFSSVVAIPGANHNYFNEQWTNFEVASWDCPGGQPYLWDDDWTLFETDGSPTQRHIGLVTASAFFRGFVADKPGRRNFQKVFDPQYHPPVQLTQFIDPETLAVVPEKQINTVRESLWHQSTELFDGVGSTESQGVAILDYSEQLDSEPDTGLARQLTRIDWAKSNWNQTFDLDLFPNGRALDDAWILSFSVARYQEDDTPVEGMLDFDVALAFEDGTHSASVPLLDYIELAGGINEIASVEEQTRYLLFNEAPIEIRDFDLADGEEDGSIYDSEATGLRFTFRPQTEGHVFLDNRVVLRKFPILGDVDLTWTVDIVDALLVAQYYVGRDENAYFTEEQADVNCDGNIDIVDALLISQYFVGLIEVFPCNGQ